MKVAAGYVGTIAGLKWLIKWNVLELTVKGKIPFRHINRHGYMRKVS